PAYRPFFPTRRSSDLKVATGASTGFAAYSLLDPTIVGDVTGDGAIDGSDVAYLKGYILNHPSRPKIPVPPGLTGIVSPSAADPRSEEHTSELQSRGHL